MSENPIAKLNDALRCRGAGGQIVVTRGIVALGPVAQIIIMAAVRQFDQFNRDNDPYGEHDCAVLTVQGWRIIFRIDYYDRSMEFASPNPADPSVTHRVMTIMLADEY